MPPTEQPKQAGGGTTSNTGRTSRMNRSNSVGNGKTVTGSSIAKDKAMPDHNNTDSATTQTTRPDLATYAANQGPGDKSPVDLATYAANQGPATSGTAARTEKQPTTNIPSAPQTVEMTATK